jgi:hypothetical protein
MMTRVDKRFIQSCDEYDDAWELCAAFAQQLRAQGLTPSHRVGVEPISQAPRRPVWGVFLYVDTEEK